VIVINPVLRWGLLKFGSPAFPIKSHAAGLDDPLAVPCQQSRQSDHGLVFLASQKACWRPAASKFDFLNQATPRAGRPWMEALEVTSWEAITSCCGLQAAKSWRRPPP